MSNRVVVLALLAALAVMVLSGVTAAAVALPEVCPAGTHATVSPGWCTSDATHIAPSSGVVIPMYATQHLDLRLKLRAEIVLAGLFVAWLVSLAGRWVYRSRPRGERDAKVVLT